MPSTLRCHNDNIKSGKHPYECSAQEPAIPPQVYSAAKYGVHQARDLAVERRARALSEGAGAAALEGAA